MQDKQGNNVVKQAIYRVASVVKEQISKSQSKDAQKPETKPAPVQAKQSLEKVNQADKRKKPSQKQDSNESQHQEIKTKPGSKKAPVLKARKLT